MYAFLHKFFQLLKMSWVPEPSTPPCPPPPPPPPPPECGCAVPPPHQMYLRTGGSPPFGASAEEEAQRFGNALLERWTGRSHFQCLEYFKLRPTDKWPLGVCPLLLLPKHTWHIAGIVHVPFQNWREHWERCVPVQIHSGAFRTARRSNVSTCKNKVFCSFVEFFFFFFSCLQILSFTHRQTDRHTRARIRKKQAMLVRNAFFLWFCFFLYFFFVFFFFLMSSPFLRERDFCFFLEVFFLGNFAFCLKS